MAYKLNSLRTVLVALNLVTVGAEVVLPHYIVSGKELDRSSSSGRPYDEVFGTLAICWTTTDTSAEIDVWNNQTNSHNRNGKVQRIEDCPMGNSLTAKAHNNFEAEESHRFRTGTTYYYQADVSLNLETLGFEFPQPTGVVNNDFQAWTGEGHRVALSVIACGVGLSGGLCSPFTVDQYNNALQLTGGESSNQEDGSLHIIQSPTIFEPLIPEEGPVYNFSKEIPMVINAPGDFIVILALELLIATIPPEANSTATVLGKIDMANSLLIEDQRVITFQEPPTILAVPASIRYGGYAVIAVAAGIILWLLLQSIQYESSSTMQITQGRFLTVFLFSGLVATAGSFLLEPRNDTYCQLGFPIVISSLQLFFAITLGRVWRIHAIVSPVVMKLAKRGQLQKTKSWRQNLSTHNLFFHPIERMSRFLLWREISKRPRSLRKSITDSQLAVVVMMVTAPQLFIQILAATLQPRQLLVDFNDDESVGRQFCASTHDGQELSAGATIRYYGDATFIWLLIQLLLMAKSTRKLPSLFDESKAILDSVVSSLVLLILGIGVIAGTRSSTSSPAVEYCVFLAVILCATLQASLRMMIPKLKMAWRNEEVVVSQIVMEHSRSIREKEETRRRRSSANSEQKKGDEVKTSSQDKKQWWTSSYSSAPSVEDPSESTNGTIWTRLDQRHHHRRQHSPKSRQPLAASSKEKHEEVMPMDEQSESAWDNIQPSVARASGASTMTNSCENSESHDENRVDPLAREGLERRKSSVRFEANEEDQPRRQRSRRHSMRVNKQARFVIDTNQPPEWRFILKMIDLEKHFSMVNHNLMTGKPVSEDDWEELRGMTSRLGYIFENEVTFKWELTKAEEEELLLAKEVVVEEKQELDPDDSLSEFMNSSLASLASSNRQPTMRRGSLKLKRPQFATTPREKLLSCDLTEMLADGPLRFAPEIPERTINEQLKSLSREQKETFRLLKADWREEQEGQKKPCELSDEMILRFLRNNAGRDAQYHQMAAWRAMKGFDVRLASLTARILEEQLLTKTLFPIPGLKTRDGGCDLFYMRPSRYDPHNMATSLVINNLVYCMSTMLEKESACTNGIGFVACMDGWTMKHFSTDYCFQFMQGLQGKLTPVNVVLFLIVNPPPWFGTVWAIMKTMLSTEFQKKVKMIPECQLEEYLAPGFEEYLPDDMSTGKANTDDLVRDWITYRGVLESDLLELASSTNSGSNNDGIDAIGECEETKGEGDEEQDYDDV